MSEVEVGTRLAVQHGPFRATATVIEVTEHGAVLEYDYTAVLVGYDAPLRAPNGTLLVTPSAEGPTMHGFLGRAHFPGAEILP